MSVEERKKYAEDRKRRFEEQQMRTPDSSEEARYRCEQFVVVKSGDVIASHAETNVYNN